MNKIINKNPSLRLIGKKTNRGFTIIETLVAITILMIAIAGPLVVANKSLTAALYAKNQITASYLAQEGVEIIRNKKDDSGNLGTSNWLNGIKGPSGNSSICEDSNAKCNVNTAQKVVETIGIFSRYYYVMNISPNKEESVTVTVTWNQGTVSNMVSITTNMTNTAF